MLVILIVTRIEDARNEKPKVARGICRVFSLGITQVSFHASGRSCLRRAALRAVMRKVIACLGRCFGTLFVIRCGS